MRNRLAWGMAIGLGVVGCSSADGSPVLGAVTTADLPVAATPSASPAVAPGPVRFVSQTASSEACQAPGKSGLSVCGVQVVQPLTGTVVASLEGEFARWLPDGRLADLGSRAVTLWDPKTGTATTGAPLPKGAARVRALRLGDVDYVAWLGGNKAELRLLAGGPTVASVDSLSATEVLPFGADAFALTGDHRARAFRLDGTELFSSIVPQPSGLQGSLDGRVLLTGQTELRVAPAARVVRKLLGAGVLDPLGQRVAERRPQEVLVYELATGKERSFAVDGPRDFAWSADGRRLAIGTHAGQIFVWDLAKAPRRWGTVEQCLGMQLVGDVVMVDVPAGTTAIGPGGVLGETTLYGCKFGPEEMHPLLATCIRGASITFDGAFHERPAQEGSPVASVEYSGELGLRVGFDRSPPARLYTSVELSASEVESRLRRLERYGASDSATITKNTVSVIAGDTEEVRETFEVALGEPPLGAESDSEGGIYVWGKTVVGRYGANKKLMWTVKPAAAFRKVKPSKSHVLVQVTGKPDKVQVFDAKTGRALRDFVASSGYLQGEVMVARDGWKDTIYDLATFAPLGEAKDKRISADGTWSINERDASHYYTEDGVRPPKLELKSVKTGAVMGTLNEPFDYVKLDRDSKRVTVLTGTADLVVLEAPSAKELARQPVPAKFRLRRMVTPDIALGFVGTEWLFVRMDDGRRLWVRAALRDGKTRVTFDDGEHFAGDLDGAVLLYRGGGWLKPDLVSLDQAPPELHRPELVNEFFTKR